MLSGIPASQRASGPLPQPLSQHSELHEGALHGGPWGSREQSPGQLVNDSSLYV